MKILQRVVVELAVALLCSIASGDDCKCREDLHTISCANLSLRSLSTAISPNLSCPNTDIINVGLNFLSALDFPDGFLRSYPNAKMFAEYNILTNLSDLEGWTGSELEVYNNRLTYINASLLRPLRKLNIGRNKLSVLNMTLANSLIDVNAQDNKLEEIISPEEPCLLSRVNFQNNRLTSLGNLFAACREVSSVKISNNLITSILLLPTVGELDANSNSVATISTLSYGSYALKYLYVDDNDLRSIQQVLGVSGRNLQEVHASNNLLISLNVSSQTKLADLRANNNSLTSLSPPETNCIIEYLEVDFNSLASVQPVFDKCLRLKKVFLSNNYLTSINVSLQTSLTLIKASNNSLRGLVVPSTTCSLDYLQIDMNNLASLQDVFDKCTNLTKVFVSNNLLTALNLTSATKLTLLETFNNTLGKIAPPLADCSLEHLDADFNQITSLQDLFEKCLKLRKVLLAHNFLISINFSAQTRLTLLKAINNSLSTIIPPSSDCALEYLDVDFNKITSLQNMFQTCSKLTKVFVSNNLLTSINMTSLTKVEILEAVNNSLTEVIPPTSCSLRYLNLQNNNITSLQEGFSRCNQLREINLSKNSIVKIPFVLLQLLNLRSRSSGMFDDAPEIRINLRENALLAYRVQRNVKEYVRKTERLRVTLTDDCACAILRTYDYQYAPVEYCVTGMCNSFITYWMFG